MGKAIVWVLDEAPKDVAIVDNEGVTRHPNLDYVRNHPRLKGSLIAGRHGKGVGMVLFGTRLGNKAELVARGNEFTTNEQILQAIGYRKTEVEL